MTPIPQRRRITAAAGLFICSLLAPPAEAVSERSVGPGHAIRYITPRSASTCTLAFAFTSRGDTYGVTAGHCVAEDPGGYVFDATSGYRGSVVSYDYDPTRRGNDFALIDFRQAPVAASLLGATVDAVTAPAGGRPICHTGIASGTSCGQLCGHYGVMQYLTTGLNDISGDSGGPVWARYGIDGIAIVGIWLGSHIDNDGTTYGRFYPLDHALTQLGANNVAR
jgi:streptogrisin B